MATKRKIPPKGSKTKAGEKKVRASSRAAKPRSFLYTPVELADSDDGLDVGEGSGDDDTEGGDAPFALGMNQSNPGGEFKMMGPVEKLGDKVWKILKDKYFWHYRAHSGLEYSYDYIAYGFDINSATEGITKFAGCEALGRQVRKIAKRAFDALNSSKEARAENLDQPVIGEDADCDSSIEFLRISNCEDTRRRVPREVSLPCSIIQDEEEDQKPAAVQSRPAINTETKEEQEENSNDAPSGGFDNDANVVNLEEDDPNPAELTGWLKQRIAKLTEKDAEKYASKLIENGFEAAELRDVYLHPKVLIGKLEMKLGHAICLASALKQENHPGFRDFDMRELS